MTDSITGDTLCDAKQKVEYENIDFPKPVISMAVSPKSKGDEDKLSTGLQRLREEDPTITIERNAETKQTLINGLGEVHVDVVSCKLKTKFGVDVELNEPIIPFRETIKKKATAEGKHKKQSGGRGQFGVVFVDFEPTHDLDVDMEFVDKVVGGAVPRNYSRSRKRTQRLRAGGRVGRIPGCRISLYALTANFIRWIPTKCRLKWPPVWPIEKGCQRQIRCCWNRFMKLRSLYPKNTWAISWGI